MAIIGDIPHFRHTQLGTDQNLYASFHILSRMNIHTSQLYNFGIVLTHTHLQIIQNSKSEVETARNKSEPFSEPCVSPQLIELHVSCQLGKARVFGFTFFKKTPIG